MRFVPAAVYHDSFRDSVIVAYSAADFIEPFCDERRSTGPIAEIRIDEFDGVPPCDLLVTCVMVAWAVTIFVGMGCLAALI